jgi:hypothetical protein
MCADDKFLALRHDIQNRLARPTTSPTADTCMDMTHIHRERTIWRSTRFCDGRSSPSSRTLAAP